MRTGSAPASCAARVVMRSTMPRGASVQSATQSMKPRNFCRQGRQVEPRRHRLEIVAGPAPQGPDDAENLARTQRNGDGIALGEGHPRRNAIGIGLIDGDRNQHVGDVRRRRAGSPRSCSAAPRRRASGKRSERLRPITPWQCLNFLPEPQGQGSLRPTRPQLVGSFGFARRRPALPVAPSARGVNSPAAMRALIWARANSSSPVSGSTCEACIGGNVGSAGPLMRHLDPHQLRRHDFAQRA